MINDVHAKILEDFMSGLKTKKDRDMEAFIEKYFKDKLRPSPDSAQAWEEIEANLERNNDVAEREFETAKDNG